MIFAGGSVVWTIGHSPSHGVRRASPLSEGAKIGFLRFKGSLLYFVQGLSGMIGLGLIGDGADGLAFHAVFGVITKQVNITQ